jgi:hypothetical protein
MSPMKEMMFLSETKLVFGDNEKLLAEINEGHIKEKTAQGV